jgi:Peptidase S46
MNKLWLYILIAVSVSSFKVYADEGMWLLPLLSELNIATMQEMGLKLTADQIYNINGSSLKDAIGALDYGSCTSELISAEGLLLTNHHCGFDEIQAHSSVEHDYLRNGFWAMTKEEELPNPGKTVSFIVRMEDVSDKFNMFLNDSMSEEERNDTINKLSEMIKTEAIEGTNFEARVEQFFGGSRFFLVVLETYRDVRLVGAPPESIGKFGYDTDNWVWPRHTGDFSIFRIYTGPDGEPADYSPENIPLKSKYFLPVSIKGFQKGDFTMVMGFPGTTNRYMTSWEVDQISKIDNPNRIKIRGARQELMMQDMLTSEELRIKYASKYSNSSNYWKYSVGQNQGIKNLDLINRKIQSEDQFRNWVSESPYRITKYGESLDLIKNAVAGRQDLHHARQYIIESLVMGVEFINFSASFIQVLISMYENPGDKNATLEIISGMKKDIANYFKDYNAPTDKKITVAMLKLFAENVKPEFQPDFFQTISKKYKNNYSKYVDAVFEKSIFVNEDKLNAFLASPDIKVLQKDPAFRITMSAYRKYFEINDRYNVFESDIDKGHRLYIEGLMEMQKDKIFYPDANSTIRLTYGRVGDYDPRDAVHYYYYTTLKGVMEKEDPANPEFFVDDRLKELYNTKDYGRYSMGDVMPVCMTTNNDITGGNSGSPVINADGQLIGIAFDGNWEAMSSDLAYEPNLQKCICVDIRYVLFIIDKFAGATNLINEMTIVE